MSPRPKTGRTNDVIREFVLTYLEKYDSLTAKEVVGGLPQYSLGTARKTLSILKTQGILQATPSRRGKKGDPVQLSSYSIRVDKEEKKDVPLIYQVNKPRGSADGFYDFPFNTIPVREIWYLKCNFGYKYSTFYPVDQCLTLFAKLFPKRKFTIITKDEWKALRESPSKGLPL